MSVRALRRRGEGRWRRRRREVRVGTVARSGCRGGRARRRYGSLGGRRRRGEPGPTRAEGGCAARGLLATKPRQRSEEHTSELQSLMRISYAVFCLKKKTRKHKRHYTDHRK